MTERHVLNLGAGVQSTTLYLMYRQGVITPQIDCAIFADTGEEPAAVYRHLAWLQTLGGPRIIVRSAGRLGEHLVHGKNTTGQRFAAIPCFTTADGGRSVGMTRRQCSKEYKVDVIDRTIRRDLLGLKPRQRAPKDVAIFQYFGISLDEASRASRIWERFHIEKSSHWEPRFPLIDRQYTRANCIKWLREHGNVPHEVPRSACVFCPFHTDLEWQRLKDAGGDDWARAVEIDRALRTTGAVANRGMRQAMYLHRTCRQIEAADFRPRENAKEMQLGFGVECEGVCGV